MQNTLRRKKGRLFPDLRLALLVLLLGLMTATSALAQLSVTGRLTSGEDKSPIPGVNILVKGTTGCRGRTLHHRRGAGKRYEATY